MLLRGIMKTTSARNSRKDGGALSRRDFIKTGATGAALAAGAGLGLFGGKAPAFAQARELHVVAWSHFIPAADTWMKGFFADEFRKATGARLNYETINANDIPARATAAVESRTGADVFQLQWNQPHLYAPGIANHDALASAVGADKHYTFLKQASTVGGTFRAVPFYAVGNAFAYRKDILKEAGARGVPSTWEDLLAAGAKVKKFGVPVGQALGHSFGDPPTFCYPLLWSFGGLEVDAKQRVVINSKETLFACAFMKEFWNAACDESGLAWDDSANNRAFLAETISISLNGASIYFVPRNNPEKAAPGLADKIGHFLTPAGPAGRFTVGLQILHSIMSYSRNQELAAEYIKMVMSMKYYEPYITLQKAYALGASPDWEKHPMWKQDPALEPYRDFAKYARNFGHAGPYDRKAAEVAAKYIIVDLFARVAGGDSAQSAIAQAERELKNVYEA
jgi:multiple sugar transport system substrate-binding protein